MRNGNARRCGCGQRGFGYLLLLFALAAMGLLLAGAGQVWHTTAQREKEAELLFIGGQFRQAISSYQRAPGVAKQDPAKLEDLLADNRFLAPRRHLRKLYRDPITDSAEWGLVKVGGRIVGVHSLSADKPFRTAFSGRDAVFADAKRYDHWIFGPEVVEAVPASISASPVGDTVAAASPGTTSATAAGVPTDSPGLPAPPAASNTCHATYVGQLRQCYANSTGDTASLRSCYVAAAAGHSACIQGGA